MNPESQFRLRPLVNNDIGCLLEICKDQSLFKFSRPATTEGEWEGYFEMLASQWPRLGHGAWVVEYRAQKRLAGWGGIIIDEADNWGPELVYYVDRSFQGQGLATFIAQSALDFANHELKLTEVTAFAHPENVGSNRVLSTQGFQLKGFNDSMNRNVYCRSFRSR